MTDLLPPPTDVDWLLMTPPGRTGSGYVIGPKNGDPHRCPLPAEWLPGAVWRCPDGHLWMVGAELGVFRDSDVTAWVPASLWRRLKHGGRKARRGMANGNRCQRTVRPTAPDGRSGILPCSTSPADFDG